MLLISDTDSDSEDLVLKGAASGIPMIISRTDKREDIFKHGESAFLCESTDVQAFSDRINDLYFCEFFIGLGSGLSWLAWAYDVPVVMISNFNKVQNEFDCYIVWTPYVFHGCFNTYNNFSGNCPLFEGTNRERECHKAITPEMVIDKVNRALLFTKNI
jgi:autotransporter strand-loop-strand O-heptosyltransferase